MYKQYLLISVCIISTFSITNNTVSVRPTNDTQIEHQEYDTELTEQVEDTPLQPDTSTIKRNSSSFFKTLIITCYAICLTSSIISFIESYRSLQRVNRYRIIRHTTYSFPIFNRFEHIQCKTFNKGDVVEPIFKEQLTFDQESNAHVCPICQEAITNQDDKWTNTVVVPNCDCGKKGYVLCIECVKKINNPEDDNYHVTPHQCPTCRQDRAL